MEGPNLEADDFVRKPNEKEVMAASCRSCSNRAFRNFRNLSNQRIY